MDFSFSLIALLTFILASSQLGNSKEVHLYKQISRKVSGERLSLCSEDGRKLPHPDPSVGINPRKYFLCQYISKADMWLIHPMLCSPNQIFNPTKQSCENQKRKQRPKIKSSTSCQCQKLKEGNNEVDSNMAMAMVTKLSAAVQSLAQTVKILTTKIVNEKKSGGSEKMLIKSDDSPNIIHHSVLQKEMKEKGANFVVSTTTTTATTEKVQVSPSLNTTTTTTTEKLGSEDEDDYSAAEEDEPAFLGPNLNQKNSVLPIPHPGFQPNQHQDGRNPFFKFFLQNLLTPPSPPPPALPFFLKTPQRYPHTPKPMPESENKGEFINLFSILNFLTDSPSPSPPTPRLPVQPIFNQTVTPVPQISNTDLERRPVHSHSTFNSSSSEYVDDDSAFALAHAPMIIPQSRRPRV